MQAILRRLFTDLEDECVRIDGAHFLIGRDEQCQFSPATPCVSRRHCEIAIDNGRVIVRDLGSRNGTYVNSERVEDTRELSTGDVLNVGLAFFEIQIADETETETNRKDSRYLKQSNHLFEAWTDPLASCS